MNPSVTWSSAIADWSRATFGIATPERALDRAAEEWLELIESPDPVEAADVVICLCGYARACGFDLAAEVEKKMTINRARAWATKGDGTGYHR